MDWEIIDGSEGEPVQIISSGGKDGDLELHNKNLDLLLGKVGDNPVAVITVAGDMRLGKSFLLNFFLSFARHIRKQEDGSEWLGDEEGKIEGFNWRGGAVRDTEGIIAWSQPLILHSSVARQKVAVILLDTQGHFDYEQTLQKSSALFALSTMMSSVQIYNVSRQIQADKLDHLSVFTDYGKKIIDAMSKSGCQQMYRPFQKLLILVRDWSYPYQYQFGYSGGKELLNYILSQADSLKDTSLCFDSLECFLMPHPGLKVANTERPDLQLKDVDEEFITNLKVLISQLLDTELFVKKLGGIETTAEHLGKFIKAAFETMKTCRSENKLPDPKDLYSLLVEGALDEACRKSLDNYKMQMEQILKSYVKEFENVHAICYESASLMYDQFSLWGNDDLRLNNRNKLEEQLLKLKEFYAKQNGSNKPYFMRALDCSDVACRVTTKIGAATGALAMTGSAATVVTPLVVGLECSTVALLGAATLPALAAGGIGLGTAAGAVMLRKGVTAAYSKMYGGNQSYQSKKND